MLRVTTGDDLFAPTAHASCRCTWTQQARGVKQTQQLVAEYEDHLATCGAAVPTAATAVRQSVVGDAEQILRDAV